MEEAPRVVLLGGGTGSYELLLGLKEWTPHLTAVVNMCDDGGSTGRLRADYGVMPPGDIRQCLTALAGDDVLARAFSHRFLDGDLAGHAAGNLLLAALELETGDFSVAVQKAADMLKCTGEILPVTLTNHTLVMQDGETIIRGQERVRLHGIDHGPTKVWLEPAAVVTPEVRGAIARADVVILAPGGLNWTLLPICVVDGVAEALQNTKAQVVCVANLMNRPEQHAGWHVVDYVREFQKYVGETTIDTVVYNTQAVTGTLLERYQAVGEEPVGILPERFREVMVRCVGADLLAHVAAEQNPADRAVPRARIRHDGHKTTTAIRNTIAP